LSKVLFAIESDTIAQFIEDNEDVVLDELNVKALERITKSDQLIKYRIKPNLRTLGQKYGKGITEIRSFLESADALLLVDEIQSTGEINLSEGKYILTRDDVFIETEAEEGFAAASDSGITVGLTIELTKDLILEGLVRDLVRTVQNLRKDAGFSVEDRIEISWDLDGQIAEAVGKFERYFCGETLTQEIKDNIENADYTSIVKLNEFSYNINLKKK